MHLESTVRALRALPGLVLSIARPASLGAQEWKWGPGARVERSGFELRLSGYAQEDFRSYGDDFENDRGERPILNETTELRRLRLGFVAETKRVEVQLQFDLVDEFEKLKDGYVELKLAKAFHIRGGNFKVPVGAEWMTSASRIDFIERSMIAGELAPGRDWGIAILGDPLKSVFYEVGVFKGDGRRDQQRADTTVAARLVLNPIDDLDIGASYSQGEVKADPELADVDLAAKGFPGNALSGFNFSVRRFVNGTRRRMGGDLHYTPGPIGLRFEVLRGTEERKGQGSVFDDLPQEVATGWTASATWLVTGGSKKRTVEVERGLHKGGPGAIEIGARYESLRFDDDGEDTGFAGAGNRARNIRPVEGKAFTGGVSWWPVDWIRLVGNVVVERFEDELLAPVPGRKGNYVTLLGRAQIAIP